MDKTRGGLTPKKKKTTLLRGNWGGWKNLGSKGSRQDRSDT